MTRSSHGLEFPTLLPEAQAELLAIDAARAEFLGNSGISKPSDSKAPELGESVCDSVDRLISSSFGESVDTEAPASAPGRGPETVVPPENAQTPTTIVDQVRGAEITKLKSDIFETLSADETFPAYHVKAVMDLIGAITVGTSESELGQIGSVLLYLSEVLGVFFDKEEQWNDHRDSYVSAALRAPKTKFRLRAIKILAKADSNPAEIPEDAETVGLAKESFDRDYDRWRNRFSGLLRANGAKSVTGFRTDFSAKGYGRTAEKCLEIGFSLWKGIFIENRKIQAELTKVRGNVLLRKIRRIEKTFDFSEFEPRKQEMKKFQPKKRRRNSP